MTDLKRGIRALRKLLHNRPKHDPTLEVALLAQGLTYCSKCGEIIPVPEDPDDRCLCAKCRET
jgi:hypothetical protein